MQSVVIENIKKIYAYKKETVIALDDISFTVEKGELFGVIGPDGAGKSSLFRILTTLLLADSGNAVVDGFDVKKDYKQIRKTVGYMPGKFSLYMDLTVAENMDFFATTFNTTVEANIDLVKDIYVQIEPFKNRRAGKLSGGMKQKLALCCALIHKPTVLFLDEPTTGVDPVSRKEFWQMLKQLQQRGITVVVSTPYMDEAVLCDRIGLMQHGKMLTTDKPLNIISRFQKTLFAIKAKDMYPLLLLLRAYPGTESCYAFGDYHHVTFKNDDIVPGEIKTYLSSKKFDKDVTIETIKPTIEDCFIAMLKD